MPSGFRGTVFLGKQPEPGRGLCCSSDRGHWGHPRCISISSLFWVCQRGTALPVEDGGAGTVAQSPSGWHCHVEVVVLPWVGVSPATPVALQEPAQGGLAGLGGRGWRYSARRVLMGDFPSPFSCLGSRQALEKSTLVSLRCFLVLPDVTATSFMVAVSTKTE